MLVVVSAVVAAIVLAIVLTGVLAYNRLCRLRDLAAEAWRQLSGGLSLRAGIDSELEQLRTARTRRSSPPRGNAENVESLLAQRSRADDQVVALRRYYNSAAALYGSRREAGWGRLYGRLRRFPPPQAYPEDPRPGQTRPIGESGAGGTSIERRGTDSGRPSAGDRW